MAEVTEAADFRVADLAEALTGALRAAAIASGDFSRSFMFRTEAEVAEAALSGASLFRFY